MIVTEVAGILAVMLIGVAPQVEFVASAGSNIDGLALNNAQCLAVNAEQGEFLVADALNDRVVIFDTAGAVVHVFPLADGRHNPFGIAVNRRGEILVGAMDRPELWLYDYGGAYLGTIALPDSVLPGRLLFAGDDEILVVDRAGRGILRIDGDGNVLGSLASDNHECKPSAVYLDRNGDIALVSIAGAALTGFDREGKTLYSKGEHGRRLEDFSHPTAALIDSAGWLWVVDSFRHHVKRYDPEGKFVDVFGQRGVSPGEFYFPVDIKTTPSGRLAVLDKGSGRIQIFRLEYENGR